MNKRSKALAVAALACANISLTSTADAHGGAHKSAQKAAPMVETDFGRTGDPKKITRTITVDMADTMRFSPAALTVKRGDTIRFVVRNKGKVLHEMVIGTKNELVEHAEQMKKHPNMEHDEPYMAHVDPGKQQTMIWQFTKAGEFYYGCLVPGHFEAGMIGKVVVKP